MIKKNTISCHKDYINIMGDHQHDFTADQGTLSIHLIQDAQHTHRPLQLVSLDIKNIQKRRLVVQKRLSPSFGKLNPRKILLMDCEST
jgi:hypothetical protein